MFFFSSVFFYMSIFMQVPEVLTIFAIDFGQISSTIITFKDKNIHNFQTFINLNIKNVKKMGWGKGKMNRFQIK